MQRAGGVVLLPGAVEMVGPLSAVCAEGLGKLGCE